MKNLQTYLLEARENGTAIGHFNVSTLGMLRAVFAGAKKVSEELGEQIPLCIGVSEGERDFLGIENVISLVKGLREREQYPIFINADHTYSVERAKEAIDAGFDSLVFDAVKDSYEDNVRKTKEVVAYRNEKNPACLVEAELGFIGSGSSLKEEIPDGVSAETMTKLEDALAFVRDTGIDLLAPSVGNVHGMIKSGQPALSSEKVTELSSALSIGLVLHGGSGSADEDMQAVIKAGISMIHISTELRLAFRSALQKSVFEEDLFSPYKFLKPALSAVQEVVEQKLKLFNFL